VKPVGVVGSVGTSTTIPIINKSPSTVPAGLVNVKSAEIAIAF